MRRSQHGMTLVVSLIMLVVLTLLVVSAIRFGNINLMIANNAQVDTEASAAAQVAIEQMLSDINAADDLSTVSAKSNLTISTGGKSYTANVTKPSCILSANVTNTELDPTNTEDQKCFGESGGGGQGIISSGGQIVSSPTECKKQNWETTASVSDSSSGASVTMVQGVSVRVSSKVTCP